MKHFSSIIPKFGATQERNIANTLVMAMVWTKQRTKYWCGFWLPTMTIGILFASIRKKRETAPATISNIAVFLLEHIGDAVVTIPLLRQLRIAFPEARILVVTNTSSTSVLENCPYFDDLMEAPQESGWMKRLRLALNISKALRSFNLDLAILPKDARFDGFEELISIAAECKWKVTLGTPNLIGRIKPMKFSIFYDEIIKTIGTKHEVEYRLSALKNHGARHDESPILEMWLGHDTLKRAQQYLRETNNAPNTRFVAFGIGASLRKRCWPIENYASVINVLCASGEFVPVVIAGPDESQCVKRLSRLTNQRIHYWREATVGESTALIAWCSLFVGNDSGPMHLAASLGLPIVEVSCHPIAASQRHFNSPKRYGPFGVENRILQPSPIPPCGVNGCVFEHSQHCISQIRSESVVRAAIELLDGVVASETNSLDWEHLLGSRCISVVAHELDPSALEAGMA